MKKNALKKKLALGKKTISNLDRLGENTTKKVKAQGTTVGEPCEETLATRGCEHTCDPGCTQTCGFTCGVSCGTGCANCWD
jgi:hypothetical protein